MYYNIVRKLVRNKPSDFKDSLSQLFESISTEKEDLPTDRVSYSSGHEFGLELKQQKRRKEKRNGRTFSSTGSGVEGERSSTASSQRRPQPSLKLARPANSSSEAGGDERNRLSQSAMAGRTQRRRHNATNSNSAHRNIQNGTPKRIGSGW